jgi:gliding motility-associated-like protein
MTGSICVGTNVSFIASPSNGGSSPGYQWSINGNYVGDNNPVFTTTSLANGDSITCILTNSSSCNAITSVTSNSIIANVGTTISPSVSISASATGICENTPIIFTALASNAGNNPRYQWKINDIVVGNLSTYTANNLANTDQVQCFVTADNTVCSDKTDIGSNKLTIQVYAAPAFTIQPDKATISRGDSIQLVVSGASNIAKYEWSPSLDISNNSINDPIVWPNETRTYTLTTTSSEGCTLSKNITVSVLSGLFIPTAFTPNNDGLNDVWVIKGLELFPDCRVTIFNRWGEMIYQSNGYAKPWDGKFNSQENSTTTFVYLIELKGMKPLKGTVTVIK